MERELRKRASATSAVVQVSELPANQGGPIHEPALGFVRTRRTGLPHLRASRPVREALEEARDGGVVDAVEDCEGGQGLVDGLPLAQGALALADQQHLAGRFQDHQRVALAEARDDLVGDAQQVVGGDRLLRVPDEVVARFRKGDALMVLEATGEVLLVGQLAERSRPRQAGRRPGRTPSTSTASTTSPPSRASSSASRPTWKTRRCGRPSAASTKPTGAHGLVRPGLLEAQTPAQPLTWRKLVYAILAPYRAAEGSTDRVIVNGTDLPIAANSVTALALVLHELATNAAKSGSLSAPTGSICIETKVADDQFLVSWEETGGPHLNGAPDKKGFGSLLAHRIITRQLGGGLSYDWRADGVIVKLSLPTRNVQGQAC